MWSKKDLNFIEKRPIDTQKTPIKDLKFAEPCILHKNVKNPKKRPVYPKKRSTHIVKRPIYNHKTPIQVFTFAAHTTSQNKTYTYLKETKTYPKKTYTYLKRPKYTPKKTYTDLKKTKIYPTNTCRRLYLCCIPNIPKRDLHIPENDHKNTQTIPFEDFCLCCIPSTPKRGIVV